MKIAIIHHQGGNMSISDLTLIVGFFAALSAASQGIVNAIKTLLDKLLKLPPAPNVPPDKVFDGKEMARQLILHVIGFAAAWFSAAWFAYCDKTVDNCSMMNGAGTHANHFDMFGVIHLQPATGTPFEISVIVAGLLCGLGGSFWGAALTYATALTGVKTEQTRAMRQARLSSMPTIVGKEVVGEQPDHQEK
ncbi:MAG: hypothetical protein JST22_01595 [Bacteroidetes bacterium]|nr:hypothetical protein [Bacteroidota bacterium]